MTRRQGGGYPLLGQSFSHAMLPLMPGLAPASPPCAAAGEGGNDLLGTRKQTGEQKLLRGNLALVGNIVVGALWPLACPG